MIEIALTQGQVTVIDDVDSSLTEFKWQAQYYSHRGIFCAVRRIYVNGRRTSALMHRSILSRMLGRDLEQYEQVDHINLNTLDNRRENLRLASQSQNKSNSFKYSNNKSGYKGVSWYPPTNKWAAKIRINSKQIHLGYFINIEDAAEAYKQAAIKYRGEFARWTE